MDAILAWLQSLSKNPPQRGQNNSGKDPSIFKNKDKEDNESKDKEEGVGPHRTGDTMKKFWRAFKPN